MDDMSTLGQPAVEMLWETADPADVLADRFGLADADAVQGWLSTVLGQYWGVVISDCQRIVLSDHNALAWLATSSGMLVAKWSVDPERFARLSALADLTQWLTARGAPVSALTPALDGRACAEPEGALLVLQRVIEGNHLDVASLDQVRAAGACLARMHGNLAEYPRARELVQIFPQPSTSLTDRVSTWLECDRQYIPAPMLTAMRELIETAPAEPMPIQLLHGDYRAANILCAGTHVLAVIDFDEARFDHPIDEVARSAVMLGTLFQDWGPVSVQVRAEFLAGYQSERRLSSIEAGWWDILVGWYALAMIPRDLAHDMTGWRAAAHEHLAQFAHARVV